MEEKRCSAPVSGKKKICNSREVAHFFNFDSWSERSTIRDGWWKLICNKMRSRPSIYVPCWIFLSKAFWRYESILCPYRENVDGLERLCASWRFSESLSSQLAYSLWMKLCVSIVLQCIIFFVCPLQVSAWLKPMCFRFFFVTIYLC